jgi:hypothetical protein
MKVSLKQATKEYTSEQQLSAEQLQLLTTKLEAAVTDNKIEIKLEQPHKPSQKSLVKWLSVAAIAVLTILSTLLLNNQSEDPSLSIVKEVVKNHIRQKPLEVFSESFAQTSEYFTQLDFVPLQSNQFVSAAKMLGGRYCSIKSQTAAQIRYIDTGGKHVTLYQVGFNPELFGTLPNIDNNEQPSVYYMDGLQVSLWTEKGLMMASVETP